MSIHHLSRGSHLGGCDLAARPLRRLPINKCDLEKTTLTCFSLVSGISRDCGGGDRSCTWHGRHNSPQQPTCGRSLARRFRASRRATLRVAQPRAKGRTRLSGRPLCRPLVVTLRSEATKGLRCNEPGSSISANSASSGELAAVDDARAA